MKKQLLLSIITYILISVSVKVYAQAPTISYTPSTNVYTAGTAIPTLTPTVGGGAADSYSVDPLPAGLSFDTATGIITGTPTTVTAINTYTVTAISAANGNGTTTITLTVNPAAPAISYNSLNTFTYGTAIAPLNPTSSGGAVDSYSVSPALPTGLSIDPTTGIISGTPTAAIAAADYTVTATNVTSTATFPVNITVGKATLTVTANDQTKVYGAANPALTLAYSGFVNGDTQAAINTLPTGATTATAASPVTTYPITASGGVDNNY
ncbi:MAG: MBG domain-containing protein, partial [Sphingobacteriales bacterium]